MQCSLLCMGIPLNQHTVQQHTTVPRAFVRIPVALFSAEFMGFLLRPWGDIGIFAVTVGRATVVRTKELCCRWKLNRNIYKRMHA